MLILYYYCIKRLPDNITPQYYDDIILSLNSMIVVNDVNVGLDIGTGFVKISGNGVKKSFPSLYSCGYSDIGKTIEDVGKQVLREVVGVDACNMGENRNFILLRPVVYGVPSHYGGFAALAKAALSKINTKPEDSQIVIGISFDAKSIRSKIEKMVISKVGVASCIVVPQAYGTLLYCNKKYGTVVNVGHGTTEILSIKPSGIEGISIRKGGEFITSQLDAKRGSHVDAAALFEADPITAAKLVALLAEHIADELRRFQQNNLILAGGGALMPGLQSNIEKAINGTVIVPEDPVFSNAVGLEILAKRKFRSDNSTV